LSAARRRGRSRRAQQSAMPVIGFLASASPGGWADRLRALRQGLSEAGYVEHRNVAIAWGKASNAQNDQLNKSDTDQQHCKRHGIVFEPMPIIGKHHVHPYSNA
jgi:hypothetical protein